MHYHKREMILLIVYPPSRMLDGVRTTAMFLKLFTGAKMPSVEFERLKNKVSVAAAVIQHQAATINARDTEIVDLKAKLAAAPVPVTIDVTEEDYAALTKVLEDAAQAALSVAPADSTLAVDGLSHPALS